MSRLAVVYLVWVPAGVEPVRRYVESIRAHAAGTELNLYLAVCGADAAHQAAPVIAEFDGLGAEVFNFEGPRIDLFTYRECVDRIATAAAFLFMNSYNRVLADNWLAHLEAAIFDESVGVVGVGGSYESFVNNRRFGLGVIELPHFPRFPNPHVRTSMFGMRRDVIEALDWPEVRSKRRAWRFESGRDSLTRQVRQLGLRAVVIDREGKMHDPEDWPESETFRAGEQAGLLVADRRSDDFAKATPEERRQLRKLAWRRDD